MEMASRIQERENPSPTNSPNSSSNSNGVGHGHAQIQTPPITPKPVSRSDTNPYPTTFVQADTSTFKQVVQMLTGSSKPTQQQDPPPSSKISIPPIKTGQKKQGFKLYERRNSLKNGLIINPLHTGRMPKHSEFRHSPRMQEILSPSILDFPALVLSPVTPLIEDPFDKSSPSTMGNSSSEEDRAIANKGYYLHPSPRAATPRGAGGEPQLLPLFPVTSPRVTGSSS